MPRASPPTLWRTLGLISKHLEIFWWEIKGAERPTAAAEPPDDVGYIAK